MFDEPNGASRHRMRSFRPEVRERAADSTREALVGADKGRQARPPEMASEASVRDSPGVLIAVAINEFLPEDLMRQRVPAKNVGSMPGERPLLTAFFQKHIVTTIQ